MNGFTFGGSSNVLPDYDVTSPFGTTKSREASVLEALTRMQAGGFTPPAGMLTATGGYEQPPELPPDDLRGGLYDWFIENASDFPIEDAEWLLETFGVSIEDLPAFIETATLEQLGALNTYKNVIQTEGWSDLSDWEKDRAFLEAGLPDIYGTAGQQPGTSEPPATDVGEVENLLGGIRGEVVRTVLTEDERTQAVQEGNWDVFVDSFPNAQEAGQWIKDRWEDLKGTLKDVVQVVTPPNDYAECAGESNGGYNSQQECMIAKTRVQLVIPGLPNIPLPGIKLEDVASAGASVLGTIKDIIEGAGDAAAGVWDWIKKGLEDGTIDISTVINGVMTGDYTFGGLFDGGGGDGGTQDPTTPVTGGPEPEPPPPPKEPFDRIKQTEGLLGQFTTGFPEPEPEPETEPFDRTKQVESLLGQFTTGLPEPEPEPDPLAGGDGGGTADAENLLSIFRSAFDQDTVEEEEDNLLSTFRDEILKDDGDDDGDDDFTFGGTAVVTDEPEPEPPDPFTGGGGGGGGAGSVGGGSGQAEEFLRGLSYQPLQVPRLIQTPFVNFAAGLTPQPMSKTQQFMADSIVGSLFGDYI